MGFTADQYDDRIPAAQSGGAGSVVQRGAMMKTVRRLTVEIERRRVEWSISVSDLPSAAAKEHPAELCPHCGSPWMVLNHTALSAQKSALADLQALLLSRNLHVRSTPSGELWICRNSFEQLKENL